jgi:hypothetical protein
MGFAGSRSEAFTLAAIAVTINLALLYGFMNKPVIDYHLSTDVDYNETIDLSLGNLNVNLEMANTGLSPGKVGLTIWLYNMSVVSPEDVEETHFEGYTELKAKLHEPIDPSKQEVFTVTVSPLEDSDYLILAFRVSSYPVRDPVGGFYTSFSQYSPERPTAVLLRHLGDMRYMRVRSR